MNLDFENHSQQIFTIYALRNLCYKNRMGQLYFFCGSPTRGQKNPARGFSLVSQDTEWSYYSAMGKQLA